MKPLAPHKPSKGCLCVYTSGRVTTLVNASVSSMHNMNLKKQTNKQQNNNFEDYDKSCPVLSARCQVDINAVPDLKA